MKYTRHFFTGDGTFGSAHDCIEYNTTQWNKEQWQQIEECSDNERSLLAAEIHQYWERYNYNLAFGKTIWEKKEF